MQRPCASHVFFAKRKRCAMSKKVKPRVYARGHEEGMTIYVEQNGEHHYVASHRKSNNLFFYLCDDGKTVSEIRSYRPSRNRNEQRLAKSLAHVLRQTEYVLRECVA